MYHTSMSFNTDKLFDVGLFVGLSGLCLVVALVLGSLTIMPMLTSGKVDYCYVDSYTPGKIAEYRVYGHRPWRVDALMGITTSADEAQKMLEKACPTR